MTYLRMVAKCIWEGMRRQVTHFVRECHICQQAKASYQSLVGLLQNLPILTHAWEHITMDFIEGLTKSEGVDMIVVVERLTNYRHFVALKTPFTTLTVAALFVIEMVRLHGFPTSIVSDRDKFFMSIFWREMLRLQ